jgi:hypothetical protein
MTLNDISRTRLANQLIIKNNFKSVQEIVSWMGAMQAQDYSWAIWAIGIRLHNSAKQTIEAAINNGDIFRTHVLRPTWHFVYTEDIYWMLKLTAPQIKSTLKSRHRQLNIDDKETRKCFRILESSLLDNNHLTRDQLLSILVKSGIEIKDNRASHIFLLAELEGLISSGIIKNGKPTYALLEERIFNKISLTKEEALAKLALKYFNSHGPATLQDFTWWSGLPVKDVKSALNLVQSDFISESLNGNKYFFNKSAIKSPGKIYQIHFLPAYDEFMISYKDRSASVKKERTKNLISSNGIFKPAIELNGEIIGIWKPVKIGYDIIIETELFKKPTTINKKEIKNAAQGYGNFLQMNIEVKVK